LTALEASDSEGSEHKSPGGRSEMQRSGRVRGAHFGRAAGADEHSPQPRGDLRRQQIIDAAVDLFAAKGYRGTGVAALADRVGMTAAGLLYYFGTKERLLREVVAERDQADAFGPGGPFPVALTLTSLRQLGQHNMETATLTRLYVVLGAESLDASDPLHDFFVERYELARDFVRRVLRAEIAQGRVRWDVNVDQMAQEVIAVVMGLELQWLADPTRVDLAGAIDTYVDRLIGELAAV
jgi:AcrR family transcriptional regulator